MRGVAASLLAIAFTCGLSGIAAAGEGEAHKPAHKAPQKPASKQAKKPVKKPAQNHLKKAVQKPAVAAVPADEKAGPGDRYIATQLAAVARRTPVVAIVTKTDVAGRDVVAGRLVEATTLAEEVGTEWADVVPVSAKDGFQVGLLADLLVQRLPAGRALYPDGELTDEPEQVMAAELIREAALAGVRDELPHSIAVVVEEMSAQPGRDDMVRIEAVMYVERESQKGIVIGTKGTRLRDVGTQARSQIEALLGTKVFLDLRVKVAKDWQRDPKQLRRLGF